MLPIFTPPRVISIHALLAESDPHIRSTSAGRRDISIHALLAESDSVSAIITPQIRKFLSTLSLRRATNKQRQLWRRDGISIHALLAESDKVGPLLLWTTLYFYPRSPCGERREPTAFRTPHQRFLSTLSLRRATKHIVGTSQVFQNFYPRSPCGERLLMR